MVDVADPHTAVTPVTLELSDLNRHDPAISLLQQAADGLLTVYGEQHPHTRTVERDLRKAHSASGGAVPSIDGLCTCTLTCTCTCTGTGSTDTYMYGPD